MGRADARHSGRAAPRRCRIREWSRSRARERLEQTAIGEAVSRRQAAPRRSGCARPWRRTDVTIVAQLGEETKFANGASRFGSGYSAAMAAPIGFMKNDGSVPPGNGWPALRIDAAAGTALREIAGALRGGRHVGDPGDAFAQPRPLVVGKEERAVRGRSARRAIRRTGCGCTRGRARPPARRICARRARRCGRTRRRCREACSSRT